MPAHQQVLFCPFCRESFEGELRCPEHELELVPLARLPPATHEHDLDADTGDHPLAIDALEPRYGRAWVGAAALLNALALVFPLGNAADAGLGQHATIALCPVFPVLWTLLLVSFVLLFVLARRRTLGALQGMRFLVPALAPVSPFALAIVGQRLGRGFPALVSGQGHGPGLAVIAVGFASLLMIVGGLRLGRA